MRQAVSGESQLIITIPGKIGGIAIVVVKKRSEGCNSSLLQGRSSSDSGTDFISTGLGEVEVPLGAGQGRPCRGGGDGCGSAWLEGPQTASRIICFKPMCPVNRSWVEHQVLVPHTTHDGSQGLGHERGGLLW